MNMKRVSEGVYQTPDGSYYERVQMGGADRYVLLGAARKVEAIEERASHRVAFRKHLAGLGANPYLPAQTGSSVADILNFWMECGCPNRLRAAKVGEALAFCKARCAALRRFDWPSAADITMAVLERYNAFRRKAGELKNGRIIDVEITQL